MKFEERAQHAKNPTGKKLFELMAKKKSNLAFNPDVSNKTKFLELADAIGPHICVLKTHIDILEDFDEDTVTQLQQLAKKHDFILFEDRKFADIGNTVRLQYEKGIYHIADWAPITNAHIVPGPGIIDGLKEVGLPKGNGLLLLAQMSSKGALATGEYTKTAVALAQQHADFVMGFICQEKLIDDPGFVHMTPGVKLQAGTDSLSQQYNTPQKVITENGSDVIIVGRAIFQADDPVKTAILYREAAWQAYQSRSC